MLSIPILLFMSQQCQSDKANPPIPTSANYEDLVDLFKEWAKDFEGFKTEIFPNVVFEDAPEPFDDIPVEARHDYPKVNRDDRMIPKGESPTAHSSE